ncbi:hypothetical protein [Streptomyces sp. NPDC020983]|uniref:hypothetical protein n=1 Tax=Streptomyces sp. NPDC020983 TaxID=3365106 RepID=UPI0037A1663B
MGATRETWTTEEFGPAHAGAVGVLLADGTVPAPVVLDMASGGSASSVSEWSIYDGRRFHGPRAAALRGVCSCGWTGPEHELDWDAIGDEELWLAGARTADASTRDWDTHAEDVARTAIPVPETVTHLLAQLETEIEQLAKTSPLAAVRAARRLEVLATDVGYWAARDALQDATSDQAATALGLDEDTARRHLTRLGPVVKVIRGLREAHSP